jgi:cell division protein FtsW (lipid II flippase)
MCVGVSIATQRSSVSQKRKTKQKSGSILAFTIIIILGHFSFVLFQEDAGMYMCFFFLFFCSVPFDIESLHCVGGTGCVWGGLNLGIGARWTDCAGGKKERENGKGDEEETRKKWR